VYAVVACDGTDVVHALIVIENSPVHLFSFWADCLHTCVIVPHHRLKGDDVSVVGK